jgi:hypothetical protein
MGGLRYIQILRTIAYALVAYSVVHFRPITAGLGGCLKLVGTLFFACVLAYVVVYSPKIGQFLATCFKNIPTALFSALFVNQRCFAYSQGSIAVADAPILPSLFQRPPPIFVS